MRGRWGRVFQVAGVTASLLAMIGAGTTGASASAAMSAAARQRNIPASRFQTPFDFFAVDAGYADNVRRGTTPFFPSVWQGSANVIFDGCNYNSPDVCPHAGLRKHLHDKYDAGAIMVTNNDTVSHNISGANVQIGNCNFNAWNGLDQDIQPGQSLILTATGGSPPAGCPIPGKTEPNNNFDTSESMPTGWTCAEGNDNIDPFIQLNVDGQSWAWIDSSQVLNTGGLDLGKCSSANEGHDWTSTIPDLG
jgi:hypothetical protein